MGHPFHRYGAIPFSRMLYLRGPSAARRLLLPLPLRLSMYGWGGWIGRAISENRKLFVTTCSTPTCAWYVLYVALSSYSTFFCRPLIDTDGLKECSICADLLPRGDFYSLRCSHEFCRRCLARYVESRLNGGHDATEMKCPMDFDVCGDVIPQDELEEICKLSSARCVALRGENIENAGSLWDRLHSFQVCMRLCVWEEGMRNVF